MKSKKTNIFGQILFTALFGFMLWLAASTSAAASVSGAPTPTPSPAPQSSIVPLLDTTENIFFERIGLDDGLSSGSVNVILQDVQGFLWFGTDDGLNRYDGYQFKIYRPDPEDSNSLTDGWITTMIQSSDGILWIGTQSGGLNRYDPKTDQFSHYINDPNDPKSIISNRIQVIYEDERGRLWIGTDQGLDQFYTNNQTFKHYYSSTYLLDEPIGDDITAIISDQKGFLLVGTNGSGLKKFNPLTGVFTIFAHDPNDSFSISNNFITCLKQDRNKNIWVGTQDGLNLYDPEANFYTPIFYRYTHLDENKDSISDNYILSLFLDTNGDLWIGTREGLDVFHRKSRSFIHHQHEPRDGSSLSFDLVTAIFQDEGGVLWVGTDGAGLNKYVRSRDKFAYFRNEETDPRSLSGNIITPIMVDYRGYIWIGTMGDGINILNPYTADFDHISRFTGSTNTLISNYIYSLAMGQDGKVWIGTDAGMDSLNLKTGVFIHYQHAPGETNSLPDSPITALYTGQYNKIWIGHNNGLSIYNTTTDTFTHYLPDPNDPTSLSGGYVTIIYQDSGGTMWVGTAEHGLNRFNPKDGTFTEYVHDPENSASIDNNSIQAIMEDSRGSLWIGTNGGGLNLYNPQTQTFTHYKDLHGLPSNIIYGIVEDYEGDLWLSTNYGISRFDPITETFSNYAAQDGLQSNEFNPGAYGRGKFGEIYFGGINGLTVFDPAQVTVDEYQPPVVLTNFTQDNQPVDLGISVEMAHSITLQWPNNYFEFEFAALGYSRPEKIQYAYMLENYDTDWFYAGSQRFGRYASLPGGEYTLLLQAANPDGIWSDQPLAITITVIPPIWQTNWFRAVVSLSVVFVMLVLYRVNTRRIQNRSKELESLVHERTADLQKYTEELEALYAADEKMLRTQTREHVFQAMVDVAIQMLHASGSAVLCWQVELASFQAEVASGYSKKSLQIIASQISKLVNVENQSQFTSIIFTPDKNTTYAGGNGTPTLYAKIRRAFLREGMGHTLLLPIRVDEQMIGVFAVSFTDPDILFEDLYRLVLALAQRASLSIQNANLFEQTKEIAILEERNRLARDLHDSAKQKAFAALAQLGAANGVIKSRPEDVGRYMHEAENLVSDVIQELTFLIQEMYPMALKEKGLALTLRDYIFEWESRTDIEVRLSIQNEKPMSLEKSQALYRIVQEALANVSRHSQATSATVDLTYDYNCVQVEIEDNGCGFQLNQKSNGMGLRSISERVESNHGELHIQTAPGEGTKITVRIPFERELDLVTDYGETDD